MKSVIIQEVHNIVEIVAVVAKKQIALVYHPDPDDEEEWDNIDWNNDDDPNFSLSFCHVWTNLPDVIKLLKTIPDWEGRKSLYDMTCFTVNTKPKNVIEEMGQHFNVTAVLEV